MAINITEYENLIDMVLDCTLQLPCRNYQLLYFGIFCCSIKEEFTQLPEKAIKTLLPSAVIWAYIKEICKKITVLCDILQKIASLLTKLFCLGKYT